MSGTSAFEGLPAPRPGHLTLYVLGPGFGESQVIALPDSRWLVIDTFIHQRTVPVAQLLKHFKVQTIDLLVLTHADLDHIGGCEELIQNFDVQRVWRYPGAGTLGDLLPALLSNAPKKDDRYEQLRRAFLAVEHLAERNRAHEVGVATAPWPLQASDYKLTPLAPTPHDLSSYRRYLTDSLVTWKGGKPELANRLRGFLMGDEPRLPQKANTLSVAFSLEWKGVRLLLGGDVENSSKPHSGWPGVLNLLKEDSRLELISNVTAVKAAHHGSEGAFCKEAWSLHAGSNGIQCTIVAPFSKGNNPPPHALALKGISEFSRRLILTGPPAINIPPAGWKSATRKSTSIPFACVTFAVAPDGTWEAHPSALSLDFDHALGDTTRKAIAERVIPQSTAVKQSASAKKSVKASGAKSRRKPVPSRSRRSKK